MRRSPLSTCLFLPLTLACPSQGRPGGPAAAPQVTQSHGLRVETDPNLFAQPKVHTEPKLTAQEIGDNLPDGEGPERVVFTFRLPPPPFGKPHPQARKAGTATLVFLPRQDASVPDFAAAYPELHRNIQALQQLLQTRPGRMPQDKVLPDYWLMDVAHSVEARLTYLDLPWASGVFFVTSYEQDFNPIDNQVLQAVFLGLSKDSKYVIAAKVSLAHPQLPTMGEIQSPEPSAEAQAKYHHDIATLLTRAKDDTFYPSLTQVKALLGSIEPAR